MRLTLLISIMLLMFGLFSGCSKKKEEVAQLEQEMGKSIAETTATSADTMGMPDTMSENTTGETAETPEQTQPSMMPPHPVSGYTVQVASCESNEYAEYLLELYKSRGYDAYLTTATVGDQMYYRVRIGDFDNLSEAKALRDELLDKYSVKAWIDKP